MRKTCETVYKGMYNKLCIYNTTPTILNMLRKKDKGNMPKYDYYGLNV